MSRDVYGNILVVSPTGEHMFRCSGKKAKWYLDRNLATGISSDVLDDKQLRDAMLVLNTKCHLMMDEASEFKDNEMRRFLDELSSLKEFMIMWRQHFIDIMDPKFLPVGWDVNYWRE